MLKSLCAILAICVVTLSATPSRAVDPLPSHIAGWPLTPDNTTISDAEIEQRLRFVEQRLDSAQLHSQIWQYSWLTIDTSTAVIFTAGAIRADSRNNIVNNAVNAGLGLLGVADLYLLRPNEARFGADKIRPLPEATRAEKLAKLQAAESQLLRNADRADERWGLQNQLGNAGLALAAGLIVGLIGKPSDGIVTGAGALIGGEVNFLTDNWQPPEDVERYKAFIAGTTRRNTASLGLYVNALEGGGKGGVRLTW